MKNLAFILSITLSINFFSCSENKNRTDTDNLTEGSDDSESAQDTTSEQKSTATFTINGTSYTCDEVRALVYNDQNVLLINAVKNGVEEIISFSFSLKNTGKGQQKFNEASTQILFSTPESTFTNTYKPDCSDIETHTEGTITITLLEDYTNEKEGKIEANFEGQVATTRQVDSYPCGNGKSSISKTEVVTVKGTLVGSYINANKAFDQVLN